MRFLAYLLTLFLVGTAVAQNPTILQGNYITNVFGNSNFVLNPNAQTNVANVTVSSATVTRSTTTPLVATSEFNITTSTSTGSATWSTRTFDGGMKGQNCEARFTYRGFSVGSTTAQILQGANVVAQLTLTPSTDPRIASINFPCGDLSSATTFRLQQATASLTGTNEIGGIYVGLATNMANVAQAENVVFAYRFTLQTITSGTDTKIEYDTKNLDVYNEFTTSGADIGVFTAKRAGNYQVTANALFNTNSWTANQEIYFTVKKNGTAVCATTKRLEATASIYIMPHPITCTIPVAVGDKLRADIYQNTGANRDLFGGANYTTFQVTRFPSSSELVVKPETQNVFGSVTYRGAANSIGLFSGVASSGTYTTFSSATWTGYRDFKGSRCEAPISGDNIGCQIKNMPVGTYKITVSGLMYETNSASGNNNCSYLIQETESSTDVAYRTSNLNNTNGGIIYSGSTFTGTFKNTSVANRNFIIRSAKTFDNTSGNTGTCNIFTSSSGNDKTDFNIIIEPLDQPSNSALYVQGPVLGAQTGAAISAGYVGETLRATSGGFIAAGASGVSKTNTSLTLSAGVWMCQTAATTNCSSNNCSDSFTGLSGTNNGVANTADGETIGINAFQTGWSYISSGTISMTIRSTGSALIFPDGTTTASNVLYSVTRVSYPSGSPSNFGKLYCTRIN